MAVHMEDKEKYVKQLIVQARKDPLKGRYYVYEQYKRQLEELDAATYERACIDLARALHV